MIKSKYYYNWKATKKNVNNKENQIKIGGTFI